MRQASVSLWELALAWIYMEPLEEINRRLSDRYGKFEDGQPNWRVVWSDEQLEMRHGTFNKITEGGLYLGQETGVREVPKYPYIKNKFVLEKLVPIGIITDGMLDKVSYEPIWTFEDKFGEPLPVKWEAIEFIIHVMFKAMGESKGVKYVDPEISNPNEAADRVKRLYNDLYGNETSIGDALRYRSGVFIPSKSDEEGN